MSSNETEMPHAFIWPDIEPIIQHVIESHPDKSIKQQIILVLKQLNGVARPSEIEARLIELRKESGS